MYLALDLSSKRTGWAKFTSDGKLTDKGQIVPDENIEPLYKLHYVVSKVEELFTNVDDLLIEGIFLSSFHSKAGGNTVFKSNVTGFEFLANIAGAVFYVWIAKKYKLPYIFKANVYRPKIGIKASAQKAEIQIWVINEYLKVESSKIETWNARIEELKAEKKLKSITTGKFKYQMNKLSREIEEETGLGEDVADAIALGRSFIEGK